MITAKEIVLHKAVERFINERESKCVGPYKRTLSTWGKTKSPKELDEILLSVVMTNPYTGKNSLCGNNHSNIYLFKDFDTISSNIGDITEMFNDLFDVNINEYRDETDYWCHGDDKIVTINGAGLLFEIIEDKIDILENYYEKCKNNYTYGEIPHWLVIKHDEWDIKRGVDWKKVLRQGSDYTLYEKEYSDSESNIKYDYDNGVYTETYSSEEERYAFDDETYGGFDNTHTHDLIKTFEIILTELTNIRVEKTVDVVPEYNTEEYMSSYVPTPHKWENGSKETANNVISEYVTDIESLKKLLNSIYRRFKSDGIDIFTDEYYGKFFTTLKNITNIDELKYAIKYGADDTCVNLIVEEIYDIYIN